MKRHFNGFLIYLYTGSCVCIWFVRGVQTKFLTGDDTLVLVRHSLALPRPSLFLFEQGVAPSEPLPLPHVPQAFSLW